jgi:ribosomal-protein-serine acetyltransferase
MQLEFSALRHGDIMLHRITVANYDEVASAWSGFPDSAYMRSELAESYRPAWDDEGRQTRYGFTVTLNGVLAGGSLLGVGSWEDERGHTGADTFEHMRGQGAAPGSKPHLFYLAFALLGLNRIETGCVVSNTASKRSIEKTPGFQLEGVLRQHGRDANGVLEDEYRYAILREDWERLYDASLVETMR